MNEYVQGFATVISLINPVMCAAIFAKLQGGATGNQSGAAIKAMAAVFVILALSAFFGIKVLGIFGISLNAFSVAGGIILAWMGFSMLSRKPSKPDTRGHESVQSSTDLTPLILFAASPGTITGVITLSVSNSVHGLPVTTLVSVALACGVTLLVLLASNKIEAASQGGNGLLKETVSRFMALIVLAMGLQFLLTGAKAFFS